MTSEVLLRLQQYLPGFFHKVSWYYGNKEKKNNWKTERNAVLCLPWGAIFQGLAPVIKTANKGHQQCSKKCPSTLGFLNMPEGPQGSLLQWNFYYLLSSASFPKQSCGQLHTYLTGQTRRSVLRQGLRPWCCLLRWKKMFQIKQQRKKSRSEMYVVLGRLPSVSFPISFHYFSFNCESIVLSLFSLGT